jgi:hypothetical protein
MEKKKQKEEWGEKTMKDRAWCIINRTQGDGWDENSMKVFSILMVLFSSKKQKMFISRRQRSNYSPCCFDITIRDIQGKSKVLKSLNY